MKSSVVNFALFCSCLDKLVENQYFLSVYSDVSKILWKNASLNIPSRNIQIQKSLTRSDNRQTYKFETLISLTKVTHEHEHKQTPMKMSITNFKSNKKNDGFGFTCCLSMKTTKHILSKVFLRQKIRQFYISSKRKCCLYLA